MFDKTYVEIGGGTHRHTHTITENRAPTDESVRLLKEMELAAEQKHIDSIRLENTLFDCVLHFERRMAKDDLILIAHFKVNGRCMEASFEWDGFRDLPVNEIAIGIRDKVAEKIANEVSKAFSECVGKMRGHFK